MWALAKIQTVQKTNAPRAAHPREAPDPPHSTAPDSCLAPPGAVLRRGPRRATSRVSQGALRLQKLCRGCGGVGERLGSRCGVRLRGAATRRCPARGAELRTARRCEAARRVSAHCSGRARAAARTAADGAAARRHFRSPRWAPAQSALARAWRRTQLTSARADTRPEQATHSGAVRRAHSSCK